MKVPARYIRLDTARSTTDSWNILEVGIIANEFDSKPIVKELRGTYGIGTSVRASWRVIRFAGAATRALVVVARQRKVKVPPCGD